MLKQQDRNRLLLQGYDPLTDRRGVKRKESAA